MDVHTIGHIGMWITLAAIIISTPLSFWWLSLSAK